MTNKVAQAGTLEIIEPGTAVRFNGDFHGYVVEVAIRSRDQIIATVAYMHAGVQQRAEIPHDDMIPVDHPTIPIKIGFCRVS